MDVALLFCTIPLFSEVDIDEAKAKRLRELLQVRNFESGHFVYREGDTPDGFYIIAEGAASISATGLDKSSNIYLGALKSGDWFGDLEILGQLPTRTSSVQTVKKTQMLYVAQANFSTFLKVVPEVTGGEFEKVARMRTGSYLKTLPFFSFLLKKSKGPLMIFDEERINTLGDLFTFTSARPKTTLFRQGDPADALYVVADGSVTVTATTPEKSEIVLSTLGAGEVFGELSLLGQTIRTASVTVGPKNCLLLCLKSENFQNFLNIAPEVAPSLQLLIERRTANSLKKIPLFEGILENKPWSKLDLLGALFTFESYPPNSVFVQEGSTEKKFMIIVQGEATSTINVRGQDVQLENLTPGSWIGEHCLVDSQAVQPKIQSKQDHVLVLSLTADKFAKFLKVVPEMLPHIQDVIRKRRTRSVEVANLASVSS
eukprot:TRINITY_DN2626_c0_g1_i1.p1 TRINITY_DN2626_c0_g1~~TRINITY_DN2626_c0_g1_i1.p1  ORF type:complete len:429 (+),score=96.54 TRINITY_DN2626_c0_g1_i1:50-1336(+)